MDKKYQKKVGSTYVACDEVCERRYIIESILETLPALKRHSVAEAMENCCRRIFPPRPRGMYWKCVLKYLTID